MSQQDGARERERDRRFVDEFQTSKQKHEIEG